MTMYPDLSRVPRTEAIQAAEEAWIGGVGDLGDPEAARVVDQLPGYDRYKAGLQRSLRKKLGAKWTMYRAMTVPKLRAWRDGDWVGPLGFTMSKRRALLWGNVLSMRGKNLVIVAATVTPDIVVMQGHPGEEELVLDGDWISYHTLKFVGRYTPKRGGR